LSLNNSFPLPTTLKEENDIVSLTYILTAPVDVTVVKIKVAPEASGFDPTYLIIIIVSVILLASATALIFVRVHRKRLRKAESMKNLSAR